MICTICKKTSEEVTLYPGILDSEMVNICEECAEDQKVPIIKKPSESQLTRADKTYSVRERLDNMSGRRNPTEISGDQMTTQRNLAKLKMPEPKQNHPEVLDNYFWTLNIARRRAKMTLSQLARKIDTSSYTIQDIEKGKLPENFKELFLKLEALFGIKLLKVHETEIAFTRKNRDQEDEILKKVAQRMNNPEEELEEDEQIEEIQEKIEASETRKLKSKKRPIKEVRLSDRKNLQDVTLSDLVDRKRAREKYKQKVKQDEMIGDEIDFEEL